jgi:hypothetical protein
VPSAARRMAPVLPRTRTHIVFQQRTAVASWFVQHLHSITQSSPKCRSVHPLPPGLLSSRSEIIGRAVLTEQRPTILITLCDVHGIDFVTANSADPDGRPHPASPIQTKAGVTGASPTRPDHATPASACLHSIHVYQAFLTELLTAR